MDFPINSMVDLSIVFGMFTRPGILVESFQQNTAIAIAIAY